MIGRVGWRFTDVDSTQSIAFRLAELGAPHGTVVRAAFQSAGRGRLDRTWQSPRGSSLMFSVLLRPEFPMHQLGSISILVAEALADEFSDHTSDLVQIKWPNDVLISDNKVSGILLQTRSGPEPVAVLGIGINIDHRGGELSEGATWLNRHSHQLVDIDALFKSMLSRLNQLWVSLDSRLSKEQIVRLDSRLWQLDEHVSILDADREVRGRVLGIAKSGGLRLFEGGTEREIVAGEIRRGPRPI